MGHDKNGGKDLDTTREALDTTREALASWRRSHGGERERRHEGEVVLAVALAVTPRSCSRSP